MIGDKKESLLDDKKSSLKENNKSVFYSLRKSNIIFILVHLFICVISILYLGAYTMPIMGLGDFGSIFLVLLLVLAVQGLKWLPIFSVFGIILNIFSFRFRELLKVYNFISIFVFIVSLCILLLI